MSEITFALGIPHAAHRPERVKTKGALLSALGLPLDFAGGEIGHLLRKRIGSKIEIFDRQCPYWEWASELWNWQYDAETSHCLTLQDDVKPMPGFWGALFAMVEAVPNEILALETVWPAARHFARERLGRWIRTRDGLIGVQYVFPREVMGEFLKWQASALRPDALTRITEDTLINMFCLDTGRRLWHPIPAIAEHEVGVPSTNPGHDQHPHRNVCVNWRDGDVCGWKVEELSTAAFWRPAELPPDLGRCYSAIYGLCMRWVTEWADLNAFGGLMPTEIGDRKYRAAEAARPPMQFAKWMAGT